MHKMLNLKKKKVRLLKVKNKFSINSNTKKKSLKINIINKKKKKDKIKLNKDFRKKKLWNIKKKRFILSLKKKPKKILKIFLKKKTKSFLFSLKKKINFFSLYFGIKQFKKSNYRNFFLTRGAFLNFYKAKNTKDFLKKKRKIKFKGKAKYKNKKKKHLNSFSNNSNNLWFNLFIKNVKFDKKKERIILSNLGNSFVGNNSFFYSIKNDEKSYFCSLYNDLTFFKKKRFSFSHQNKKKIRLKKLKLKISVNGFSLKKLKKRKKKYFSLIFNKKKKENFHFWTFYKKKKKDKIKKNKKNQFKANFFIKNLFLYNKPLVLAKDRNKKLDFLLKKRNLYLSQYSPVFKFIQKKKNYYFKKSYWNLLKNNLSIIPIIGSKMKISNFFGQYFNLNYFLLQKKVKKTYKYFEEQSKKELIKNKFLRLRRTMLLKKKKLKWINGVNYWSTWGFKNRRIFLNKNRFISSSKLPWYSFIFYSQQKDKKKYKRLRNGVFSKSFFFEKSLNRLAFLHLKKKDKKWNSRVNFSVRFLRPDVLRKRLSELLVQTFRDDVREYRRENNLINKHKYAQRPRYLSRKEFKKKQFFIKKKQRDLQKKNELRVLVKKEKKKLLKKKILNSLNKKKYSIGLTRKILVFEKKWSRFLKKMKKITLKQKKYVINYKRKKKKFYWNSIYSTYRARRFNHQRFTWFRFNNTLKRYGKFWAKLAKKKRRFASRYANLRFLLRRKYLKFFSTNNYINKNVLFLKKNIFFGNSSFFYLISKFRAKKRKTLIDFITRIVPTSAVLKNWSDFNLFRFVFSNKEELSFLGFLKKIGSSFNLIGTIYDGNLKDFLKKAVMSTLFKMLRFYYNISNGKISDIVNNLAFQPLFSLQKTLLNVKKKENFWKNSQIRNTYFLEKWVKKKWLKNNEKKKFVSFSVKKLVRLSLRLNFLKLNRLRYFQLHYNLTKTGNLNYKKMNIYNLNLSITNCNLLKNSITLKLKRLVSKYQVFLYFFSLAKIKLFQFFRANHIGRWGQVFNLPVQKYFFNYRWKKRKLTTTVNKKSVGGLPRVLRNPFFGLSLDYESILQKKQKVRDYILGVNGYWNSKNSYEKLTYSLVLSKIRHLVKFFSKLISARLKYISNVIYWINSSFFLKKKLHHNIYNYICSKLLQIRKELSLLEFILLRLNSFYNFLYKRWLTIRNIDNISQNKYNYYRKKKKNYKTLFLTLKKTVKRFNFKNYL